MNEITQMNDVVAAYDAETAVDQTIPIRRRLEQLGGIVVTDDNIEDAKKVRTQLNALAKDASAPRMRVQRAIKAHPIGKWAFTKSDLEREIEQKSEHIKMEIDAHTRSAETLALGSDVKTWVCFITGTLPEINKLAVSCNEKGMAFENRGPAIDEPPPPEKKSRRRS